MLWMSHLFISYLGGVSCLSAPKEVGLLVWDIAKDIFKEKNFADAALCLDEFPEATLTKSSHNCLWLWPHSLCSQQTLKGMFVLVF